MWSPFIRVVYTCVHLCSLVFTCVACPLSLCLSSVCEWYVDVIGGDHPDKICIIVVI